jgi:hypothetical protein
MNIPGYDAWKLSGYDDSDGIGAEEGQTCGRYPEPDEDMPRGYKPKPCKGVMVLCQDDGIYCDTCGEES